MSTVYGNTLLPTTPAEAANPEVAAVEDLQGVELAHYLTHSAIGSVRIAEEAVWRLGPDHQAGYDVGVELQTARDALNRALALLAAATPAMPPLPAGVELEG